MNNILNTILKYLKEYFSKNGISEDINTTIIGVTIILCSTILILSGNLTIVQVIIPEIIGVVLLFFKNPKNKIDDSTK
jgi:hypothetical protein